MSRKPSDRRWLLAAALVVLILALAVFSGRIDFRPIDWHNYRDAAANLAAGRSPYQGVEFFGPPWLAILLIPFGWLSPALSALLWLLFSLAAAYAVSDLACRWQGFPAGERRRLAANLAGVLLPVTLYVYITGQVTALAAAGLIYLATRSRRPGVMLAAVTRPSWALVAVGGLLASFKPHIVALPLLLILLDHLRRRSWRLPLIFTAALGAAALASLIWVPSWPADWLAAISGESFRGGPGLAAGGFYGLREAGVPGWLLTLPLLYSVVYWWRHGLNPDTVALAIAGGLVWVPYVRSYDFLILWPVALRGAQVWHDRDSGWFWLLPLAFYALMPLTDLALLLPVVLFGLLLSRLSLAGPIRTSALA